VIALHVGDDFAGKINRAQEIQFDSTLPVVERGREKSFGGRAASVGDANIDGAEFCGDCGDEPGNGSGVGDVEGLGENFRIALLSDFCGCGFERLLIAGAHGDAAAFGGEGFGSSEAESLTGRGYKSDAIC
jgi:hypothetical protein